MASPSGLDNAERILESGEGWPITGRVYNRTYEGIRPIVCLKSEVQLRKTANGYEIVER